MSHESNYLFVYGSLRSGFHHPAYQYISNYFELKGMAQAKGLLFDMGTYPAAIPTAGESFIIGELYKLKNPDEFGWAFGQLDDYEGVTVEADEAQLYRREITNVFFRKEILSAWIYWYNGDVSNKPVVSSGDVMKYLQHKNY